MGEMLLHKFEERSYLFEEISFICRYRLRQNNIFSIILTVKRHFSLSGSNSGLYKGITLGVIISNSF